MYCSTLSPAIHKEVVGNILTDRPNIDAAIAPQGRKLIESKYLQEGETVAERLAHACVAFSRDYAHALRLTTYMEKGWFMFATPLLSNAGTSRGLPISCFLNKVEDSREGLADHYEETLWLSTVGGGVGGDWSSVRSAGTMTSNGSETTGIVPYMKVVDSLILACKQGKTRKGAYALYLDVNHPEIEEFLELRTSSSGDLNRRCLNLHLGVNISNSFMNCVMEDRSWELIDPHTKKTTKVVKARKIWNRIIKLRMSESSEPYLFFQTTANRLSPYPEGDRIYGSNLCTEIMQRTSKDRTAVCCISSLNAKYYDEWKSDYQFFYDINLMLDNALTVFVNEAPPALWRAVEAVKEERSIGVGLMGVHTYLCNKGVYMEDGYAFILQNMSHKLGKSSYILGQELGTADYIRDAGHNRRNLHVMAVAPNASSSIMLDVSPGIEPYRSNIYTIYQGDLMFEVVNHECIAMLDKYFDAREMPSVISSIKKHGGSVQHLDIRQHEKNQFKTFSEMNQTTLVKNAANAQKRVDQGISLNLCFADGADPKKVNEAHLTAWELGLKSLYYLRRDTSEKIESGGYTPAQQEACSILNKDECLACQ